MPYGKARGKVAPASRWELEPGDTRLVVTVQLMSQAPGKNFGVVHIVTDVDELRIPVQVEATHGHIHRTPEVGRCGFNSIDPVV